MGEVKGIAWLLPFNFKKERHMTDFQKAIEVAADQYSDDNATMVTVSRCASKDPSKVLTATYDSRLIEDLKALHGLDFVEELERVLQYEVDLEYAIRYEGYVAPPYEDSIQTIGDYTLETKVIESNGISMTITKN